ncbi:MAG: hypothetical protein HY880_08470 [Deltaproteobacteria bacterium]|nr:hypothetical protein [Deltaproteobacteria bacterium]
MTEKPKKGITLKIFGIVLLSLSLLNTMFSVRAGIADLGGFNYGLMIAGAIIFSVGLLRGRE